MCSLLFWGSGRQKMYIKVGVLTLRAVTLIGSKKFLTCNFGVNKILNLQKWGTKISVTYIFGVTQLDLHEWGCKFVYHLHLWGMGKMGQPHMSAFLCIKSPPGVRYPISPVRNSRAHTTKLPVPHFMDSLPGPRTS